MSNHHGDPRNLKTGEKTQGGTVLDIATSLCCAQTNMKATDQINTGNMKHVGASAMVRHPAAKRLL
ncbi:MAG: hypothetical protein IH984_14260 [Planctomycetes bacterium]|nr:hypothetical protein [Planctomycetota bacterium]